MGLDHDALDDLPDPDPAQVPDRHGRLSARILRLPDSMGGGQSIEELGRDRHGPEHDLLLPCGVLAFLQGPEAIARSYEMTAPDYIQALTIQRVPHGLVLRERRRIADALGRLFRDRTPDVGIPGLVYEVFGDLSEADREKMAEILSETADRASPASAFLYGVTETDIQERNATNRGA